MKDKLENVALSLIAFAVLFAIIYLVKVLPYGNDFRCIFAECRINK